MKMIATSLEKELEKQKALTMKNTWFRAFPEMDLYNIPINDVHDGIKKGIIDHVEKLPDEIRKLCYAEYGHRQKLGKLKQEAKTGKDDESNS